MPPDIESFGLPPRDAIRYFRRRRARPLPSWSWLELQREAHAKMFSVAKSAGFDILGDVADAVDRAQAQGQTFAQFQADLEPTLRKRGWWGKQIAVGPDGRPQVVKLGSPRRLKTIFRTNLRVSAAAARWQRIQDRNDRFPYLVYDAVNDSRTRPRGHRSRLGLQPRRRTRPASPARIDRQARVTPARDRPGRGERHPEKLRVRRYRPAPLSPASRRAQ